MKSQNKKYLFFSFFLVLIAIPIGFVGLRYLAPYDISSENISITGNDVIKNFKIESFNGIPITSGGTTLEYGSKLKLEVGSEWSTTNDDINVISVEQIGDLVYVRYRVVFVNKLNIFTNVRAFDAVEDGKNLDLVGERISAGIYGHYNSLGFGINGWESFFDWYHLDVGNVREKTAEDNTFSGTIGMTFDIDDTPIPDTLTDSNGNTATKNFAYVSVASAYISSQTHGSLSGNSLSTVGISPLVYEESGSEYEGGDSQSMHYRASWNPEPSLSGSQLTNTVDYGVLPQSVGSSLKPTTKLGGDIWDATSERSMTDCRITYDVGSISPIVEVYTQTLSWNYQIVKTQEYLQSVIPWVIGVRLIEDTNRAQSETRTSAFSVINRYIQTKISIAFDVYCSYNVVAIDTNIPELQEPQEYYDNLVYGTVVDGFGGGTTYTEGYSTSLFGFGIGGDILVSIIIIAVIGVVIYVLYKRYKKKKGVTNIYLNK